MTLDGHNKVIRAGFRIIRKQNDPTPHIKYKDGSVKDWSKLGDSYPSKAARDRSFKEMLKNPMILED